MHALLEAWKDFDASRRPMYCLATKQFLLMIDAYAVTMAGTALCQPRFRKARPTSSLDLLPIPFVGNLEAASIFLLLLNPGFGPHDYFGEYMVSEFRATLVDNLKQTPGCSFLCLDPRFSWWGGFAYWQAKLQQVIQALAGSTGVSYGRAHAFVRSSVAALELVPYHSESFAVQTASSANSVQSNSLRAI